MTIKEIDTETKTALDNLEDLGQTLYHKIFHYGTRAVAHVHVMQAAKDGSRSLDQFCELYDVKFGGYASAFSVSISKIAGQGIYFPKITAEAQEFRLFDRDYLNLGLIPWMDSTGWRNPESSRDLLTREWSREDLKDPKIIERGIEFGQDMWKLRVADFERFQPGYNEDGIKIDPLPKYQTELGRKLIAYYSQIVASN